MTREEARALVLEILSDQRPLARSLHARHRMAQRDYSMLDVANIHYPEEDLRLSVFSPTWQAPARITQNGIDFDHATREPICKKLLPM